MLQQVITNPIFKQTPPDRMMFEKVFPANPVPFAIALAEGVHHHGTDWIKSSEAKRLLFVLNAQAYGQLFSIDAVSEYQRLSKTI